jgi:hypothetical protein
MTAPSWQQEELGEKAEQLLPDEVDRQWQIAYFKSLVGNFLKSNSPRKE